MLLPALVAAASGYLALVAINGTTPLFPVHGAPPFSFVDLAGAAVLGLTAGFGARLFAAMIQRAKHMSGLGASRSCESSRAARRSPRCSRSVAGSPASRSC